MMQYIYLFALLAFSFLGLPFLFYKLSDGSLDMGACGLFIGFFVAGIGAVVGHEMTYKEVGFMTVPSENIIIERGDYSATFHVKNNAGVVTKSIRIDRAVDLESFKKGDYSIGFVIWENIWVGKQTEDNVKFNSTKIEK